MRLPCSFRRGGLLYSIFRLVYDPGTKPIDASCSQDSSGCLVRKRPGARESSLMASPAGLKQRVLGRSAAQYSLPDIQPQTTPRADKPGFAQSIRVQSARAQIPGDHSRTRANKNAMKTYAAASRRNPNPNRSARRRFSKDMASAMSGWIRSVRKTTDHSSRRARDVWNLPIGIRAWAPLVERTKVHCPDSSSTAATAHCPASSARELARLARNRQIKDRVSSPLMG